MGIGTVMSNYRVDIVINIHNLFCQHSFIHASPYGKYSASYLYNPVVFFNVAGLRKVIACRKNWLSELLQLPSIQHAIS